MELYEAFEENGYLYSSSELCENGNLQQWMDTRGPLSPEELSLLVFQMSKSLVEVHDTGLLHMDVKPANFLVKADNTIKLGDFGNCFAPSGVELKDYPKLVDEGDCVYLAPEVLNLECEFGPKVDSFSLGLSILELLVGFGLPKNGPTWERLRNERPSLVYAKHLSHLDNNNL